MGVSTKHLQAYCAKFAFHYNRRVIDDGARFTDRFGSCRGHLAYKTLIAD